MLRRRISQYNPVRLLMLRSPALKAAARHWPTKVGGLDALWRASREGLSARTAVVTYRRRPQNNAGSQP